MEIITWDRGDTIRINNTFTDIDDSVYDPATIELKIYDPINTLVKTVTFSAAEIKKSSTGIFYYDYDIAGDAKYGIYITKWIGIVDSFTDVSKAQFKVDEDEIKLYCTVDEVWNRAGVDENVATKNEVIPLIKDSMAEIDAMYGKSFDYGNTYTEWFDTNRDDPNVWIDSVYLRYKPIIAITSVKAYDSSKVLAETYTAADYWVNLKTGRLTLLEKNFVLQKHRLEVVYTWGYEEIPRNISSLCAILSVMRLLIHQIGGTYDDVTSYNSCGLNVSVGEPYMNMSRDIEFLQKEATRLIATIGRLRPSAIIL